MKPAFKIYPQYFLSIFLIAFFSFVSCKKDDPEITPNPGNNTTLPLADSLYTFTYNTSFQYFSLTNYPGFGDWDTVKYFYFNADQDTTVDFNFKTYISVTWLGTSTPYYSENIFNLLGDSVNLIARNIANSGIATFPDGAVIDSTLNFLNYATLHVNVLAVSNTYWPNISQPYYLGIKLIRNNAVHYGWIAIEHLPDGYLLLKSVNYDLIPNSPVTIIP